MGELAAREECRVSPIVTSMDCRVEIDYTNYRGERGKRIVVPHHIFHGSTEYHPNPQWLMKAWDIEKKAIRIFAMRDIHSFTDLAIHMDSVSIGVKATSQRAST